MQGTSGSRSLRRWRGPHVAIAIALTACAGWQPSTEPPRAPSQRHDEAPQELWLFADAQLNNAAGARTRTRTGLLDHYAEHAIRPPSVDLWSGHLLAAAAQHIREDPRPAFFLGDAANTSCVGEMVRFLNGVDGLPWFGVLGNHDGYYMGNLTFAADAIESPSDFTWQGACDHDGGASPPLRKQLARLEDKLLGQVHSNAEQGTMTKAVAIWMFLGDLHRRTQLFPDPLEPENWTADGDFRVYDGRGNYWLNGRPRAVRAIAAVGVSGLRSDTASRSWKGYLLQDIEVPSGDPPDPECNRRYPGEELQNIELPCGDHAILLDTSDYERPPPSSFRSQFVAKLPGVRRFPGEWGRIGAHQARNARAMQAEHASRRFFLMGHHPWRRLDGVEDNDALKELLSDRQFATYVSGHTHAPTAPMGTAADEQWELNVASLTDWPMQIARVAYWGGPGYVDLRVQAIPVVATPGACGYGTQAAEEMHYGEVEDYISRSLTVYQYLLGYAVSLQRHPRAPEYLARVTKAAEPDVPDVERRRVLAQAIEYDRTELGRDPDIVRVETDCAVWASNLEGSKNAPSVRPGDEIGASGAAYRVRTNPFRPVIPLDSAAQR